MAESPLLDGEVYGVGFAGIGGFCNGFEQATGVPPYFACNHDSYALAIHRANHPETNHFEEDVFHFAVQRAVGRVMCRVGNRRKLGYRRAFQVVQPGISVGWGHLSPDCRDHSRAKGGKPISKEIRGLAWAVKKWAEQISPRIISVENVPEFKGWGPLVAKRDKATGRCLMNIEVYDVKTRKRNKTLSRVDVAPPATVVPYGMQVLVRDRRRQGQYFRQLVRDLEALGYVVERRELCARDYGAPTSRKRLFILARRDGQPIVWPEATYGAPSNPKVQKGKLPPFRTTAQCLDFIKPDGTPNLGKSIFGRKKSHADPTLRRVAYGVKRYVLDRRPFIVNLTHGARLESIDDPATTITAAHRGEKALCTPVLMSNNSNNAPHSVEDSLGTVTTGNRHYAVSPLLTKTHSNGWDRDGAGVVPADEPAGTLLAKDGLCVVAPSLIQTGYGERKGQSPRVLDIDAPLGTAPAQGQKHAVVGAFLAKHNDGNASFGIPLDRPADTITTKDHHALVAASLIQQNYGSSQWQDPATPLNTLTQSNHHAVVSAGLAKLRGTSSTADVEEPAPTISAQGQHLGLITGEIVKFFGQGGQWQGLDEPLHTATTKARFAAVSQDLHREDANPEEEAQRELLARCARVADFLERFIPGLHFPDRIVRVEIDGVIFVIADIFMRMLTPRELARCQGFDDSYILFGTVTQQVGGVGNSVPPQFAKALAAANTGRGDGEQSRRMAA
jgi:DNA (cytosine-5)-methyltransferase 1